MEAPLTVILLVTKGSSSLLVKNDKGQWTLPGGIRDPNLESEESIKSFAHVSLYPIFTGLVIRSVHLIMEPIKGMTFGDDRVDVVVFKCHIEGSIRPEAEESVWFVPLEEVPVHAVAPDMRGVIEMLAAPDRFPREHAPKD